MRYQLGTGAAKNLKLNLGCVCTNAPVDREFSALHKRWTLCPETVYLSVYCPWLLKIPRFPPFDIGNISMSAVGKMMGAGMRRVLADISRG